MEGFVGRKIKRFLPYIKFSLHRSQRGQALLRKSSLEGVNEVKSRVSDPQNCKTEVGLQENSSDAKQELRQKRNNVFRE